MRIVRDPGSLRDPDGAVYRAGTRVLRIISAESASRFSSPPASALIETLAADGLLIGCRRLSEEEWRALEGLPDDTAAVYEHVNVPFVSYPYEWPFSLLKEAALSSLEVLRRCLAAGFVLKDASAFNIQFVQGRPVFIDMLSVAPYAAGTPWVAYAQFCRHFLNPLLLTARAGVDFHPFMRAHLDGLEPDETLRMLPLLGRFRPPALVHVLLQARLGAWVRGVFPEELAQQARQSFSVATIGRLAEKLATAIAHLDWRPPSTPWITYEAEAECVASSATAKRAFVADALLMVNPALVWDLGANTGAYSMLAVRSGRTVVALDREHVCVELLARRARGALLPLVMDLANPSPDQGFAGCERTSLTARGPADLLLATALIHHLVLGHGLPLPAIIDWMAGLCHHAVLEFVPASDPRASALITRRGPPNGPYSRAAFEALLRANGAILRSLVVPQSTRILYLWKPADCLSGCNSTRRALRR